MSLCQQPQAHPDRCGCSPAGTEQVSSAWLAQLRSEYRQYAEECERLRGELQHRDKLLEETRQAWDMALKGCEQLRAKCDAILSQARNWACEAKTQRRTVQDVGQILGGVPDWGPIAAGVEAIRAERDQLRAELTAITGQEPVAYVSSEAIGGVCWRAGFGEFVFDDRAPLYALPPQQPDAVSVPRELEALTKDAERYRWLCEKFGVTKLPCAIERILDGDVYVPDGKNGIDRAVDEAMQCTLIPTRQPEVTE